MEDFLILLIIGLPAFFVCKMQALLREKKKNPYTPPGTNQYRRDWRNLFLSRSNSD
jgi:hypothetical protein